VVIQRTKQMAHKTHSRPTSGMAEDKLKYIPS
jgi:hypothetical protein